MKNKERVLYIVLENIFIFRITDLNKDKLFEIYGEICSAFWEFVGEEGSINGFREPINEICTRYGGLLISDEGTIAGTPPGAYEINIPNYDVDVTITKILGRDYNGR